MPTPPPSNNHTYSTDLEWRTHLVRFEGYHVPNIVAIAISSGIPPSGINLAVSSDFLELQNLGGYARFNVYDPALLFPSGGCFWGTTTLSGAYAYNQQPIAFPSGTANWGVASGLLIADSDAYNSGSGLYIGTLIQSQFISSGMVYIIPISGAYI